MAHDMGATLCRIAPVHPEWFYLAQRSNSRGFKAGENIHPLPSWWKNVIVLTNTMNFDTMYADPNYGSSTPGYTWTSTSAQKLTDFIRRMGYPARWSTPRGGYDTFMVPNLVECGMGSVGRTSNCLGPDFGGDWRPGLIITDLDLEPDPPIDMKLDQFCKVCKLCAEVCPTDAISMADDYDWEIHGLRRWYTNHHKCRDGWSMVAGPTGCRACVAVCPASRKNTWAHRLVKELVYRDPTGISQRIATTAEKIFFPKNMGDELVSPLHKGVTDPPQWLVTESFISGFTETPAAPEVA
jgi:reductive dehalogenase